MTTAAPQRVVTVSGPDPDRAPARPEDEQPAAVELRGLEKRFAVRRPLLEALRRPAATVRHAALRDVSFRVPTGCCFGLLGPNGAGKSTVFRILATLVLPDQGTATVGGLDVVEDAQAVRELVAGSGADERSLFWRLSGAENLRLYASLHRLRGAERSRRVEEALSIVGLEDSGGQMVGRYSSGMRQRLLLARALLSRPRVLLLDEPTRSLDPVAARAFRDFLRRDIVERQGCTVLLATHAAEEAFGLCDAVAVLDRGRVVAQGRATVLAASLGADRLILVTRDAEHALLREPGRLLTGARRDRTIAPPPAVEPGWEAVVLHVPGGAEGSALLLRRLAEHGVEVARAESARPSLADLLASLTASPEPGAADA